MMGRSKGIKKFLFFSLYGFGVPLIIILITLLVDFTELISKKYRPEFGRENCWIKTDKLVQGIYVYFPICTIMVVNVVLFSITAFKIHATQKETKLIRKGESQKHSKDDSKNRTRCN